MPCVPTTKGPHRERIPSVPYPFNAAVARPVSRKEVLENAIARAAMQKEWNKHHGKTWKLDQVREWKDVQRESRRTGVEVFIGRVFGFCVEKNSELPAGHPNRKFKGRAVFEGNRVRNENSEAAIFSQLSSCPASIEAGKFGDLYACQPGNDGEQADAESAYTQAYLGGTKTWVRIPRDQWPPEWEGMVDPVVPLILALYGHPEAGGYWERHCEKHLLSVGFKPIRDWKSCFWHPKFKLFLTVYVDDFKLTGPKSALSKGWDLIRQGLKIDDPAPLGLYLGCRHSMFEHKTETGHRLRGVSYDQEDFLKSCVDRYKELSGVVKLPPCKTPFLEDPPEPLANDPPPKEGQLRPHAASILMKTLYAARVARPDLLKPVCYLACCITRWDEHCDRQVHRLMRYINCTYHHRLIGFVDQDSPEGLTLDVFADADFAGCRFTKRSTTGGFLCAMGKGSTFFPLSFVSKRQSCVSHSTPEAEIVAADHVMRLMGIPALDVWETILPSEVEGFTFHEDNTTMISVCNTGRNPTMRHIGRTHKVSIAWLHERFAEELHRLEYEFSDRMRADIFTKAFPDPLKWAHAIDLIGVLDHPKWVAHPAPVTGGPLLGPKPEKRDKKNVTPDSPDGDSLPEVSSPASTGRKRGKTLHRGSNIRGPNYRYTRAIVDFNCDPDTPLKSNTPWADGCLVERVTCDMDPTSPSGVKYALEACSHSCPTLLWASIPGAECAGNFTLLDAKQCGDALFRERARVVALFNSLLLLGKHVDEYEDNNIAIEAPTHSRVWTCPEVRDFISNFGLVRVNLHACAFGLMSQRVGCEQVLCKRPTTIATNSPVLIDLLGSFKCGGGHVHDDSRTPGNAPLNFQTPVLVSTIHRAWTIQTLISEDYTLSDVPVSDLIRRFTSWGPRRCHRVCRALWDEDSGEGESQGTSLQLSWSPSSCCAASAAPFKGQIRATPLSPPSPASVAPGSGMAGRPPGTGSRSRAGGRPPDAGGSRGGSTPTPPSSAPSSPGVPVQPGARAKTGSGTPPKGGPSGSLAGPTAARSKASQQRPRPPPPPVGARAVPGAGGHQPKAFPPQAPTVSRNAETARRKAAVIAAVSSGQPLPKASVPPVPPLVSPPQSGSTGTGARPSEALAKASPPAPGPTGAGSMPPPTWVPQRSRAQREAPTPGLGSTGTGRGDLSPPRPSPKVSSQGPSVIHPRPTASASAGAGSTGTAQVRQTTPIPPRPMPQRGSTVPAASATAKVSEPQSAWRTLIKLAGDAMHQLGQCVNPEFWPEGRDWKFKARFCLQWGWKNTLYQWAMGQRSLEALVSNELPDGTPAFRTTDEYPLVPPVFAPTRGRLWLGCDGFFLARGEGKHSGYSTCKTWFDYEKFHSVNDSCTSSNRDSTLLHVQQELTSYLQSDWIKGDATFEDSSEAGIRYLPSYRTPRFNEDMARGCQFVRSLETGGDCAIVGLVGAELLDEHYTKTAFPSWEEDQEILATIAFALLQFPHHAVLIDRSRGELACKGNQPLYESWLNRLHMRGDELARHGANVIYVDTWGYIEGMEGKKFNYNPSWPFYLNSTQENDSRGVMARFVKDVIIPLVNFAKPPSGFTTATMRQGKRWPVLSVDADPLPRLDHVFDAIDSQAADSQSEGRARSAGSTSAASTTVAAPAAASPAPMEEVEPRLLNPAPPQSSGVAALTAAVSPGQGKKPRRRWGDEINPVTNLAGDSDSNFEEFKGSHDEEIPSASASDAGSAGAQSAAGGTPSGNMFLDLMGMKTGPSSASASLVVPSVAGSTGEEEATTDSGFQEVPSKRKQKRSNKKVDSKRSAVEDAAAGAAPIPPGPVRGRVKEEQARSGRAASAITPSSAGSTGEGGGGPESAQKEEEAASEAADAGSNLAQPVGAADSPVKGDQNPEPPWSPWSLLDPWVPKEEDDEMNVESNPVPSPPAGEGQMDVDADSGFNPDRPAPVGPQARGRPTTRVAAVETRKAPFRPLPPHLRSAPAGGSAAAPQSSSEWLGGTAAPAVETPVPDELTQRLAAAARGRRAALNDIACGFVVSGATGAGYRSSPANLRLLQVESLFPESSTMDYVYYASAIGLTAALDPNPVTVEEVIPGFEPTDSFFHPREHDDDSVPEWFETANKEFDSSFGGFTFLGLDDINCFDKSLAVEGDVAWWGSPEDAEVARSVVFNIVSGASAQNLQCDRGGWFTFCSVVSELGNDYGGCTVGRLFALIRDDDRGRFNLLFAIPDKATGSAIPYAIRCTYGHTGERVNHVIPARLYRPITLDEMLGGIKSSTLVWSVTLSTLQSVMALGYIAPPYIFNRNAGENDDVVCSPFLPTDPRYYLDRRPECEYHILIDYKECFQGYDSREVVFVRNGAGGIIPTRPIMSERFQAVVRIVDEQESRYETVFAGDLNWTFPGGMNMGSVFGRPPIRGRHLTTANHGIIDTMDSGDADKVREQGYKAGPFFLCGDCGYGMRPGQIHCLTADCTAVFPYNPCPLNDRMERSGLSSNPFAVVGSTDDSSFGEIAVPAVFPSLDVRTHVSTMEPPDYSVLTRDTSELTTAEKHLRTNILKHRKRWNAEDREGNPDSPHPEERGTRGWFYRLQCAYEGKSYLWHKQRFGDWSTWLLTHNEATEPPDGQFELSIDDRERLDAESDQRRAFNQQQAEARKVQKHASTTQRLTLERAAARDERGNTAPVPLPGQGIGARSRSRSVRAPVATPAQPGAQQVPSTRAASGGLPQPVQPGVQPTTAGTGATAQTPPWIAGFVDDRNLNKFNVPTAAPMGGIGAAAAAGIQAGAGQVPPPPRPPPGAQRPKRGQRSQGPVGHAPGVVPLLGGQRPQPAPSAAATPAPTASTQMPPWAAGAGSTGTKHQKASAQGLPFAPSGPFQLAHAMRRMGPASSAWSGSSPLPGESRCYYCLNPSHWLGQCPVFIWDQYVLELEKTGRGDGVVRWGNPDEFSQHLVRIGLYDQFWEMIVQEQRASGGSTAHAAAAPAQPASRQRSRNPWKKGASSSAPTVLRADLPVVGAYLPAGPSSSSAGGPCQVVGMAVGGTVQPSTAPPSTRRPIGAPPAPAIGAPPPGQPAAVQPTAVGPPAPRPAGAAHVALAATLAAAQAHGAQGASDSALVVVPAVAREAFSASEVAVSSLLDMTTWDWWVIFASVCTICMLLYIIFKLGCTLLSGVRMVRDRIVTFVGVQPRRGHGDDARPDDRGAVGHGRVREDGGGRRGAPRVPRGAHNAHAARHMTVGVQVESDSLELLTVAGLRERAGRYGLRRDGLRAELEARIRDEVERRSGGR